MTTWTLSLISRGGSKLTFQHISQWETFCWLWTNKSLPIVKAYNPCFGLQQLWGGLQALLMLGHLILKDTFHSLETEKTYSSHKKVGRWNFAAMHLAASTKVRFFHSVTSLWWGVLAAVSWRRIPWESRYDVQTRKSLLKGHWGSGGGGDHKITLFVLSS